MKTFYTETSSLRTQRLFPETSTKLYLYEFGFRTVSIQILTIEICPLSFSHIKLEFDNSEIVLLYSVYNSQLIWDGIIFVLYFLSLFYLKMNCIKSLQRKGLFFTYNHLKPFTVFPQKTSIINMHYVNALAFITFTHILSTKKLSTLKTGFF